MASNILTIPFRKTHAVSLSEALKEYISEKYDQHPDMFAQDLETIDELRTDAVTVQEAHTSGIQKIAAYAAQLVWIGGKFPIDIGVEFSWYPCLGFNTDRPISESNLRFELANVLFNLAALYSQLAFSLNRTTSDGLKAASSYFCQAAGVIEYLKSDIVPDMRTAPPEDMDVMTLESVEQLLLAQAQECSWSMAIKSGRKDWLVSRLAAKVSDFYDQGAEHGTRSDSVSTQRIHHMSAKHHHFAAAAQYRAACDCLEKRKYGEEIARLKDALICVNEALKEAKWVNKTVQGDLNGLKMKVTEDLKRAEKDNDMIYLQNVPPKSELKILERQSMVAVKPPSDVSDPSSSLGDHGSLGIPLFTRLVPYSVHIAASIYADRRDRLVNTNIIDELEALTDELRDLLQSLNLPGSIQALERPLGLPPSLTSHAEEIRQQDGLHKLRRTIREVESLKETDVNNYKEGVAFLQSEASDDERARMKHGTDRWTRPPSQQACEKLYMQTSEIEGYLKSAHSSDELVKTKVKDVEPVLKVMEGTNRDLEEYVPSSRRAAIPPKLEQEVGRLRDVLNEVSRLESRRRKTAESLRGRGKADDINPVLLAEVARLEREFPMQKIEAVQFEDLFTQRLAERYDAERAAVADERAEQDALAQRLQDANAAFASARVSNTDPASRAREQALQRLEGAYRRFHEILSNLDAARKFYNDLAKMVTRYRDACRDFRYQRRLEANQFESDLSNAMSSLSLSQAHSRQDRQEKQALRAQFRTEPPAAPAQLQPPLVAAQTEPRSTPLPAPQPTRAPVAPMAAQQQQQQQQQPPPPQSQPLPQQSQQQPQRAPQGPMSGGTWTPDAGIRFGGGGIPGMAPVPAPAAGGNVHNPAYPNTRLGGQWSPSRGLKFG